jgi:hypothetical protein
VNPPVKERVDGFLAALERDPVSAHVLGVVVSGSAARGEEIWAGDTLLSDIDLMVLVRRTDPRLIGAIDRVMAPLRHTGIDGGAVPVGPLRRHHTLAFHEARANGVVVAGRVDLATLVPDGPDADLPVWEGVRILGNRVLEHVKYVEGLIPAERVVAKSYEALAEAYLVAERRYRPSYRERLAELEYCAPHAPPQVYAAMLGVLRARLGGAPFTAPVEQARAHLVNGLARLITRYAGIEQNALAGLVRLGRFERHWHHRLYWNARLAKQHRWAEIDPTIDPILRVWQRALRLDAAPELSTSEQRRRVLADWRACPQILVHRPTGGST